MSQIGPGDRPGGRATTEAPRAGPWTGVAGCFWTLAGAIVGALLGGASGYAIGEQKRQVEAQRDGCAGLIASVGMLGLTLQGALTGGLVGTAVAFIVFLALQFWSKKARRTSIGRPDQAMPPKPTVPEIDGELG